MLRIHHLRQWFGLSDPAMEEAQHDVPLSREFAGLGDSVSRYGEINVNALAGLISAGVCISCLPIAMFTQEIERGQLQLVKTTPTAPKVPYHFCFLRHLHSALGYGVADIAKRSFSLTHEA